MKQLLHIIFITCVISGLLLPSPGTTPTASAQEGPVTVTENDTSAWVKYEDVAHGFTILVPPNAQVSPAEALPGSRTRVSLTGLGEADCGVTISFGVFVVDKPVEVDIETWTRPNPNWEEDLIDEGPTDSKGAFSYFQRHSGISDGLQRDVLRAYATRGGKVYFADLEPATSLIAEEAFWAILRSFVFVHSLDKSQPSVLSAYNQEAELVRAPAEPMSSPPPGYAVPIGGDKMITQRPHSAFTHACTGMYWRDCEAIDIEVNIDGHDPIFAPAAGTYIPVQSCYGNTATIYHANGTVTHLGHLDSFGPNIASGFVIQQGEVAGLGGNTFDPSCGKSSGPHVHWVLRDSSNVSVPISGAAGIDLASNLAHGGVTVNYSPSMTWSWPSNVLMFTADQTSLPVSVGTLRSLIVGKGWITTLYRSTGFQNRYATYFGPTSMSLSSLQTRSLRVFDDVCPVDSAPTAESETIEALTTCYAPPPSQVNDNVAFVNDVSVPDGSVLSPGQSFTKTWLVRNTGTSTWGANYQLVFHSGNRMSAPTAVNLPALSPGQTGNISVNMIAPSTGGHYQGNWRLRNPQGTFFGDTLWVKIVVPDGTVPPPPANPIELRCLDCPTTVPPGETFRPTIRATVNSGQLLVSRGDMLKNTDGNLYGAWPHIMVTNNVNQGQTHDFTFYANDPLHAPDTPGTYESKWRVWRNGAWAGDEITIRFAVEQAAPVNHPPISPTLTGPGDWAVYYGNTGITLSSQHNGDPDGDAVTHYYFEIFESAQNANSGWITSNSWSPQGLGFNNYQWRVKVRDSRGAESSWSPLVWHFSLLNNDPQIYSFNWQWCRDAWGGPERICFCAQTNAGTLRLQVNNATDGSGNGEWQVLNELGTPNYSCATDNDRPPNWTQLEYETGCHLVRLYARRDGGWANAAKQDLTICLPADRRPNSPGGQQPLGGSYVNSHTVTFDWTDTLRTTGYRLEASASSNYATLLLDQQFPVGTSQYVATFTTDYPTVYWRVTATGPYGTHTTGQQFSIDVTPPSSVVAALPPVTTDTTFSVNWSGSDARSGLRWYHVQVRDGDRPDSEWTDWLVNTTKTVELFSGQPGHTYYFRVRAMDEVGNWEDWPAGNGDTFTLVDPTAIPPTPWWNIGYANKRNLIILNNDGDTMPAGYPVRLRFNATTTPTAAELYNASLTSTKGNDVRVVYNDQTELNRVVQRFTSSQIDIWFPLQVGLGGGQTNNSSYQIYYGNAGAGAPPADVNTVFVPKADGNTMGLWHFQENSGSAVYDSSGRAHHGSFSNGGWTDGLMGWAGSFNGVNSTVQTSNHPDFDNLLAMTLEMWVYPTRSGWGMPLVKGMPGYGQYSIRINGDNNVEFTVGADGGNQTVISNTRLQQYRWYHIAAVHDGGSNQWIYIDGVQERSKSDSRPALVRTYPLYFGNAPWWSGMAFQGNIQHVRISNVARHDFSYARIDIAPTVAAGSLIPPPVTGSPDLAVLNMWTYPHSEGGVLVEVVVQNTGSLATGNNFFTDLYVDHIPTGPGDYTGSLRFWLDSPIAAGAVVTLTTVLQGADSLAALRATEIAPGDEITGTLYAQTDSTGAVGEPNQANNIYALGAPFCLAVQDAYEENDSFSSATPIALDEVQRHNIGKLQDSDWLSFQASEGVTYTLYTLDLDPAADTVVSLYATDGVTLLDTNDDALGTLASRIDWAAPATGEYYIRVQHWNPNVSGCGTGYSVSVITTPMAPNVVITASGEDVQLMWPHLAANASYEVWRDVVPYFDPDYPNAETILLDVITPDTRNSNVTYVDTSGLPNMSYFYLIRGKNGGITSDNSNRVGKFVRSIGPGMNLVSLPLTPDITAVQGVIGDQLTGASSELYADRIWVWDTDTQDYDYAWLIDGVGPPYDGQWWDGDPWGPSGITLEPGMGFWVQNRQTFSQTLVFVGSVLEAAEHSVEIGEGMQLIGSAYPVEQTLYEATFAEDGAHGASSELYADRIWYWDESLQDYDYAWLIDGVGPPYDGQWWDGDPWGETTITLTPGVGYWYQRRGSGPFLWTNPGNAP